MGCCGYDGVVVDGVGYGEIFVVVGVFVDEVDMGGCVV